MQYSNWVFRLYYNYISRNKVKYARKLGVRVGANCKFMVDPVKCFGTEPWLISIGDNVEITSGVEFLTHEGAIWVLRHSDDVQFRNSDKFGKISVGNNVMIGVGAVIMPGVSIGNNVIIGARSVITTNIVDNVVIAGCPAKVICSIDEYKKKVANECVNTKHMTSAEKKSFLYKNKPELFE